MAKASADWMAQESEYYVHTFNRQPIVVERGEGLRVWDVDGKEYLDMTAGLAVNNLGHAHPVVAEAIREQAGKLLQMSNLYYTVPQLELAEALVENSCMDKVFFANSGVEANEGAVKLARKYGRLHRNGAQSVITVLNSFHGRTLGMIAATGQPAYQQAWLPLADGFTNVPYDDLDAIREATTDETCAIMVEVVQGEGGVNVPTEGYLKGLREWCDQKQSAPDIRRGADGHGPPGTSVGLRALRRRARRDDDREGARQRRARRRVPLQGELQRARAGRPRQHVRRQRARDRRRERHGALHDRARRSRPCAARGRLLQGATGGVPRR